MFRPMNETGQTNISIALIGFSAIERRLVGMICSLSSKRARAYHLVDFELAKLAPILLVDSQNNDAVRTVANNHLYNSESCTVIMVGKNQAPAWQGLFVRKPFVPTRVLAALDQIPYHPGVTASRNAVQGSMPSGPQRSDDIPSAQHSDATSPATSRYKVLVIDDSLAVRKTMELKLGQLDIAADFAENATQAFEFLDRETYDLVFLDVVLPDVDGYKICKTIKRDKSKKQMPVVMLTGKSSPFDQVRGRLSGCNTYLTKPVDHRTFQKVIDRYLPDRDPTLMLRIAN